MSPMSKLVAEIVSAGSFCKQAIVVKTVKYMKYKQKITQTYIITAQSISIM